ncbi:hypothetical protein LTR36_006305 [Oleoguttula mirabilis]|uniref:Major facilitator superfamily (MFS) profile domain-containing protein n=1 Tax=Oleoguttula mirabilis TaxID=1507867 RepID=A0AAV9JCF8_9PEZI|nr:hypothetical protein LTR36_006305 [Oleoguttula mirabilis]
MAPDLEKQAHHHHHPITTEPAEEPGNDIIPQDDPETREPEESLPKQLARPHAPADSADTPTDWDTESLASQRSIYSNSNPLEPVPSSVSTHDHAAAHPAQHHHEPGDAIYARFSPRRKALIVAVLSFCSFLAPISSTSILAASPEVVQDYHTTVAVFGYSNALYLIFMGLSPLFWGPLGQTYGRKWTLAGSAVTFTAFSIGSALAPSLAAYFVMRVLTAFAGTSFLIVGAAVVGDIYRPVERGTAYGWFLSGTLIGPALGPLVAGIIVTFVSWRYIFWLQVGLATLATLAVITLVPETIHHKRKATFAGHTKPQQLRQCASWLNPWRVIVLFRYPNLLVAGLASSSLVWNMYSLLTPIRTVLNPRFGLTSPIMAGLFFIAPGAGYLVGTFFGGHWADRVVKQYIAKRNGRRVPEDRLHSCLIALGLVIPACMLAYGWSVQLRKGGVALPVIAMFIQGVAQLFCFPSLNTYCIDVMQSRSGEVVAGNYVIRYFFAAAGTAACQPAIGAIGVGWFSTISAGFLVVSAGGVWLTAEHGSEWREKIDGKVEEEGEKEKKAAGVA